MIFGLLISLSILILGIMYIFSDEIKEMYKGENTQPEVKNIRTSNQQRIIVNYQGSKYDITNFIRRHPGGRKVLIENNGKDIEKLMLDNGHSENAYNLLDSYKIS